MFSLDPQTTHIEVLLILK